MNRNRTFDLVYIAIFSALISVFSQISVPLPLGVPLTLQTFIIPTAGIVLGKKKGTLSTLLYVLMGAMGLPVFAGFKAGFSAIFGLTGGFIISFPLMALISGVFSDFAYKANEKESGSKSVRFYFVMLAGQLLAHSLNYVIGTLWYMAVSGNTLLASIMGCVIPFIPITLVKIVMILAVSVSIKYGLKRSGILRTV